MKLTEFKNPLSGEKGDIADFGDWKGLILGGVVLALVFGLSGSIVSWLKGRVGGGVPTAQIFTANGHAARSVPAAAGVPGKVRFGV